MPRKLKVYRTPIGFHDAYVAAASQKAALAAWGSDADLFARGMAETVTDAALCREPLDKPGVVIRRPRGTTAEHMAALPRDEPAPKRRSAARSGAPARPKAPDKPAKHAHAPRPSRALLDAAEQALDQARTEHEETIADIRRRERALQTERRDLEARHEADIARLETAREEASDRHRAALERWRA